MFSTTEKEFFDWFSLTLQDSIFHEQLQQTVEPTVPGETLEQTTGQDRNRTEGEHRQELKSTETYKEKELPPKVDDAEGVDPGFWGELYEADYPRDEETLDDYIWCKF